MASKKTIKVEIEGKENVKQVETEKEAKVKTFFKKVGHGVKKAAKATAEFCDEHPGLVICALTGGLYTAVAVEDAIGRRKGRTVRYKIEWGEGDAPNFNVDKTE